LELGGQVCERIEEVREERCKIKKERGGVDNRERERDGQTRKRNARS
jgi:hypothetical protein